MPEFNYRAVNTWGKWVTGTLKGENLMAVRQSLKNEGLLPVEIKPASGGAATVASPASPITPMAAASPVINFKRKISGEALHHFCRQLAVILRSGVNLIKGLEIMARQTKDKRLRAEVERIYQDVQTGLTIAEAMGDRRSLIPELLAGMVATGEASGTLDQVLRSMAEFYEKDHRIKQKIKAASIYPIVMAVMAMGLIAFFFNFLLPQMVTMINASGGKLPLLTRIVIGISEYTTKYYLIFLAISIGSVLFLHQYFKTPVGRMTRDMFLLRIPMLGKTLRDVTTMRFASTAHILIRSGLPLLQGLDYIKKNVDNALAGKALDYAIEGLQMGETLASNLQKANYFDVLAIQMISIGEETGELEKILEEMAEFYEQESNAGFTKLLAVAEPAMLVIIGSIVSVIIISVMLPMMDMFSNIKR